MKNTIILEEISFYAFFALCAFFFVKVLREPHRFLTFPILAGMIWIAYVAPQAVGILYNPIHLPYDLFKQGYTQTMIMCMLCVLMGAWGWHARMALSEGEVPAAPVPPLDPFRLMIAGSVLTVMGLTAFLYIARQTGGIIAYYSVGGSYALDWLGGEVIAVFFSQAFLNSGLIILMFSFFLQPRLSTAVMACLAISPSLADILILSRRSDAIYVAISVFGPAYFVRNWAPSRRMIMIGFVLGLFIVFVFPVIRGTFVIGSQRDVNLVEAFQSAVMQGVLGGEQAKEFNNSVGIVGSTDRTGDFGLGAAHWNRWVSTTIPRTLLGQELKDFLSMQEFSLADIGMRSFGWQPVWYQSQTAAAMLFADFWYFGCLAFYLIGHWFAGMFARAQLGNLVDQIRYTTLVLLLPHWVAVGFYKAPRNIILTLIIIAIVTAFARGGRALWTVEAAARRPDPRQDRQAGRPAPGP